MVYGRIYVITNLINGKQYVGQTKNELKKRFTQHKARRNEGNPLFRAFTKYGKENFTIEELSIFDDQSQLDEGEIHYISKLNTLSPNGYNLKSGGNGSYYSDESRVKMTDARNKFLENNPDFIKEVADDNRKRNNKRDTANSKYKGVSFRKERGVWQATLMVDGVYVYRKSFNTEYEAAKAYDYISTEYFEKECYLNFPEEEILEPKPRDRHSHKRRKIKNGT